MVRAFLRRIATPIRGLHQAAYLLAFLTLASQLLALIRDRTFAHVFGATTPLDVYYAAFKIPNLVFTLVASLVSAYVLIPRIASDSQEDARKLISHAASFLLLVGGIAAAIIALIAPQLLSILFPRFMASSYADTFVMLVRLLLLQPMLLGLSGVLASVTQVHRRFIIYALSPVLYNLGIILGITEFYPHYGLMGIGYGVVLGAVAYLAVHIPVVIKARLVPRLTLPSWKLISPVMRDSIPRTLALSVGSLVSVVIAIFAARAGSGTLSIFTYATNLEAVPVALIGSSYAVAAFPVLAELSGKGDVKEFTRTLSAAARHLVVWSAVIFGLAVVLRAHFVRVILGTGHFNWNDTRLTAAVFAILIAALAAQSLVLLLSRALYAVQQSWRPLMYQLIGGAVAVVIAGGGLYYLHRATHVLSSFGSLLRVGDVSGNIVLVFALAVTIGQFVTVGLCLYAMRSVAPGFNRALLRPLAHGLIAMAFGAAAAYAALAGMGNIAPLTTLVAVFTQGLAAGIVGLIVVAGVLMLLHNQEFADMRRAVHRFAKKRGLLPTFGAS